jgi:hypothetical protein
MKVWILILVAVLLAACGPDCPAGSTCYTAPQGGQSYQFHR